jgi:hypothetical protein
MKFREVLLLIFTNGYVVTVISIIVFYIIAKYF